MAWQNVGMSSNPFAHLSSNLQKRPARFLCAIFMLIRLRFVVQMCDTSISFDARYQSDSYTATLH